MATKDVLRPEVKEKLLKSQEFMGILADKSGKPGKQTQTIQRQIKEDSPELTKVGVLKVIKELLGLNSVEEVVMEVQIGDKSLHVD